jgi:hypothetical protein
VFHGLLQHRESFFLYTLLREARNGALPCEVCRFLLCAPIMDQSAPLPHPMRQVNQRARQYALVRTQPYNTVIDIAGTAA